MDKDKPMVFPWEDRIFLTVKQARSVLGISATHFYRLVDRGELRIAKSGKRTLVPVASVKEYAEKIMS